MEVTTQSISEKIELLSKNELSIVATFIDFIQSQSIKNISENSLLSENALAKDWLSKEEDEAWKDL